MLGGEQVVNKLIKLPLNVGETDLKLLSAVLNASMTDIPLDGFTAELMEKVMRSAGAAASLVPVILDFTQETLKNSDSTSVAVTGQARLLSLPEYRDVDKAQRVMDSIDEEALANLPAVMEGASGTKVLVGPENVADELKDTSVVMTKFDIGDGMQGMIGVVGPTRMDYAKVTARLSYFAESLSKRFGKPEQPPQPMLPEPPKEESKSGRAGENPRTAKAEIFPHPANGQEVTDVAKKETEEVKKKAPEETPQEAVEETPKEQAPEEPELPQADPWEEKYNSEHDARLRLAAEYDNFRKRTTKEKEQSYG